jgi:hypothetical protein
MRSVPCGGGIEYLHRRPASHGRRRKGKQCLGVWPGHPTPGGYKYGDLALQVGEYRIWGSKTWSWFPIKSDLIITGLARANRNCKRQARPLVTEDITQGLQPKVFSWNIKVMVVGLKGLVAKMNWLAISCQSWSNSDSDSGKRETPTHKCYIQLIFHLKSEHTFLYVTAWNVRKSSIHYVNIGQYRNTSRRIQVNVKIKNPMMV